MERGMSHLVLVSRTFWGNDERTRRQGPSKNNTAERVVRVLLFQFHMYCVINDWLSDEVLR